MKKGHSRKWAVLAAAVGLAIGSAHAEEAKPAKPLDEGTMQIGGSSPVGGVEMV